MLSAIHTIQGITVITPTGQITMGDGDLYQAVQDVLASGARHILIDLGHVTFVDSFGIGQLIGCYTTVTNQGGLLKLCTLSPRLSSILQITMLTTVFDVYPRLPDALASFPP
jgi:anti-sigma B factor antagonist